jgi:FkbM family methyltransferase
MSIKTTIVGLLPRQGKILRGFSKGMKFDATGGTLKYLLGDLESEEENMIASITQPNAIVYDIGANIGYYAIGIARKIGEKGQLYAFEPSSEARMVLERNVQQNQLKNVRVIPHAVSNKTGMIPFHVSDNGTMSSINQNYNKTIHEEITIQAVSLDDFVFQEKNPAPQFVLIDVEGAELLVLEGMREVLKQFRPTILCEIHWLGEAVLAIEQGLLKEVGYEIKTIAGEKIPTDNVRYHALIQPLKS